MKESFSSGPIKQKDPVKFDRTLLREHYMKMKKLLYSLLHDQSSIQITLSKNIVVKCQKTVVNPAKVSFKNKSAPKGALSKQFICI